MRPLKRLSPIVILELVNLHVALTGQITVNNEIKQQLFVQFKTLLTDIYHQDEVDNELVERYLRFIASALKPITIGQDVTTKESKINIKVMRVLKWEAVSDAVTNKKEGD